MSKKPNIVYFMSDDHSANAISCYGSILADVFKTPNLDSIAENGVKCNHYYATNSICTPARATVMTGQYGHVTGVRTLGDVWEPAKTQTNLAPLIQEAGYTTALFGKWHLGCTPVGFDEYKYLGGDPKKNGEQGSYQDPCFIEKGKGAVTHEGYVTDIITDMTIDWLKNRDKDKPFMLMCQHKAPHDFWEFPERHTHLFDGVDIPVPDSLFEDRSHRNIASRNYGSSVTPRNPIRSLYVDFSDPNYVVEPLKMPEDATFEEKGVAAYTKYIKDYCRTVKGIDDSVGTILKELEDEGILDDTIIIYTADQGMFLGEHDYQDKRWSFEESLRAPFLIQYKNGLPKGHDCDKLICNLDVAPLLLDYAGAKIPAEMQGISPRGVLEENIDAVTRKNVYFRYWMHRAHRHDNPAHYGIRTEDYKLIFYYGLPLDASGALNEPTPAGWELYDMKADPLELHNIYDDPKYAQVIKDLKKELRETKELYGDTDEKYPELLKLLAETK